MKTNRTTHADRNVARHGKRRGAALPEYVEDEAFPSLAPLVERVTPAVVNIRVSQTITRRSRMAMTHFAVSSECRTDPADPRKWPAPDPALSSMPAAAIF